MITLTEIRNVLNPENVGAKIIVIDDIGRETKAGRVYSLHLADDKTVMKISIWDKNILANLKVGDLITITKAYITIFQNEPQLNLAKDGKIEVTKLQKASNLV